MSDGAAHDDPASAEGLPTADALAGIRLPADGIEVRRSREEIRARLFNRSAEPARLGRFVVLEQLGVGGMGVVYAAYDPQLDRRVALKVIRTDAARKKGKDRNADLVQEARAMAKLSHPNVITVFEVGTVQERVFIAMECVDGMTLRDWWSAQPRSHSEILDVLIQAGEGLAAAHEGGLVHRDFKPENVLVSRGGSVRVTDFGLAQRLESETSSDAENRPDESKARLVGTPAYMAPEQLRGRSVDARSDQYAFCLTLFEALTGARPRMDIEVRALRDDPDFVPTPASVPSSTGLSRRQRAALERGLAIDPHQRHSSMRTLLRALAHRDVVTGVRVALAASLLLGGTWVGLRVGQANRDECERPTQALAGVWDDHVKSRARDAFEAVDAPYATTAWARVTQGLDEYTQAWLDSMLEVCRTADPGHAGTLHRRREACLQQRLDAIRATTALLVEADRQTIEHSVASVVELPSLDTCRDPDALRTRSFEENRDDAAHGRAAQALEMARASWRFRRYEEGRQWADDAARRYEELQEAKQVAQAQELLGRFELALANVDAANRAFEHVLLAAGQGPGPELVASAAIGLVEAAGIAEAQHEEALVLARAAEIASASAGNPPRLRSRLGLAYARILYGAGRLDEGLQRARQGFDALEQLGASRRPELAEALQAQGTLLYAKGRLDEAQEMSTRALALRRSLFGPRHPEVAESLVHLAAIDLARRRVEDAVKGFSEAAAIQRGALGSDHPAYARTLANLGSAHRTARRLDEARVHTRKALEILQRHFDAGDPRLAALEQNLAGIAHELGDDEEAMQAYRAALEHQRAALGAEHPQVATTLANVGRLLLERGDVEAAVAALNEALTIRRKVLGADHPKSAAMMVALAEAAVLERRFSAAERMLREAESIYIDALGPEHAELASVFVLRGKLELRRRRPALAQAALVRARELLTDSGTAGEVAAVDLLRAQAAKQAGDLAQAGALARAIGSRLREGPLPPELRSWCETDCEDELAALEKLDPIVTENRSRGL